jgi:hypothetical protein
MELHHIPSAQSPNWSSVNVHCSPSPRAPWNMLRTLTVPASLVQPEKFKGCSAGSD